MLSQMQIFKNSTDVGFPFSTFVWEIANKDSGPILVKWGREIISFVQLTPLQTYLTFHSTQNWKRQQTIVLKTLLFIGAWQKMSSTIVTSKSIFNLKNGQQTHPTLEFYLKTTAFYRALNELKCIFKGLISMCLETCGAIWRLHYLKKKKNLPLIIFRVGKYFLVFIPLMWHFKTALSALVLSDMKTAYHSFVRFYLRWMAF